MNVSGINCATPFRAKVESQSPLVSGNWAYLQDQSAAKADAVPKKKYGLLKKALIAAAVVVAAGFAFAKARGLESIKAVMDKSFSENTGFMNKTKWVIGKIGDGAIAAYEGTIGKLVKMFKGGEANKPAAPAPAPAPATPAAPAA